jgi:surface antigen
MASPSDSQPENGNAIRHAMMLGNQPQRYTADTRECRRITQEVVLPSGQKSVHHFTACRQPDGAWAEV